MASLNVLAQADIGSVLSGTGPSTCSSSSLNTTTGSRPAIKTAFDDTHMFDPNTYDAELALDPSKYYLPYYLPAMTPYTAPYFPRPAMAGLL